MQAARDADTVHTIAIPKASFAVVRRALAVVQVISRCPAYKLNFPETLGVGTDFFAFRFLLKVHYVVA
jgi:hypothetical protein